MFTCLEVTSAAGLIAKEHQGNEFKFLCPNHNDHHPSLWINKQKDTWFCKPCGAEGNPWQLAGFLFHINPDDRSAMLQSLEDHRLINGKREPDSPWKKVNSYAYHNPDGSIAFHIERWEQVSSGIRKKKFVANPKGAPKIIYNLPAVLSASTVFIVEGEKCANVLNQLGYVATTNPFGAGKWLDEYNDQFKPEQHVVIFPDNDEPGKRHADKVANSLVGRVASVKICNLPGLHEKQDVYDFVSARTQTTAIENIDRFVSECPEFFPPTITGGDPVGDRWLHPFNEDGMAEWLIAHHPETLFHIENKLWFHFDETHWVEDPVKSRISKFLQDEISYLNQKANSWFFDAELKHFYKFLQSCGDARKINAIIELASRKVATHSSLFDQDPFVVNFQNGTLDLRSPKLILRTHRSEDLITRCVPYPLITDPSEAVTKHWDSFLNFICEGNENYFNYFYRMLGYCLSGDTSQHMMFLLWGPALNGKTTLIDTMIDLLGSGYARKASIGMLKKREGGSDANPELASSVGVHFIGISEGFNKQLDEELIKQIVTGELVTTRGLYGKPFTFRPRFKIICASNVMMPVATNDEGYWRKVHELPMMNTLKPEQIDTELKAKLLSEASGILFKLVKGWHDYYFAKGQRLVPPDIITNAISEHREQASDLAGFMSACIEKIEDDGTYVTLDDLHSVYQEYTGNNISKSWLSRKIQSEFRHKFVRVEKVKSGVDRDKRVFFGMRLTRSPSNEKQQQFKY